MSINDIWKALDILLKERSGKIRWIYYHDEFSSAFRIRGIANDKEIYVSEPVSYWALSNHPDELIAKLLVKVDQFALIYDTPLYKAMKEDE